MTTMEEFFGEPISVYTRADAIEDGTLIDVTETAKEMGFSYPIALTNAVYEDCVAWDKNEVIWQDESGRLQDVLWMLMMAIRKGFESGDLYELIRIPRNKSTAGRVKLKAIVGPGDNKEPVITIMQPDED